MINNEEHDEPSLRNWERKLLIVAFGGWMGVAAVYGQMIIVRIDRVVGQLDFERTRAYEVHAIMDRRITILEQQSAQQSRVLDKISDYIDRQNGAHVP